jgi:hypothetical protein
MELDIFIPTLSIAFEYQGIFHYKQNLVIGSAEAVKRRDQEKRIACKQYGITLIEVPYWWKKDKESLIEMITKQRPDLLYNTIKI